MSSKWVQVRDSLLEAVKAEEVGKEFKDNLVGWAEGAKSEMRLFSRSQSTSACMC